MITGGWRISMGGSDVKACLAMPWVWDNRFIFFFPPEYLTYTSLFHFSIHMEQQLQSWIFHTSSILWLILSQISNVHQEWKRDLGNKVINAGKGHCGKWSTCPQTYLLLFEIWGKMVPVCCWARWVNWVVCQAQRSCLCSLSPRVPVVFFIAETQTHQRKYFWKSRFRVRHGFSE